jgi:hypothetical protein
MQPARRSQQSSPVSISSVIPSEARDLHLAPPNRGEPCPILTSIANYRITNYKLQITNVL